MQFECYVLMKFEAVERYLDLLLMGFLFLEHQRLADMKRAGDAGGAVWVQPARPTACGCWKPCAGAGTCSTWRSDCAPQVEHAAYFASCANTLPATSLDVMLAHYHYFPEKQDRLPTVARKSATA
jgi:hypothetical protein